MKQFRIIRDEYLIVALHVATALLLLTPLITSSSFYFPFITPRNFFFRIIVEIMALLYVVLVCQNRKYLPAKNLITTGLLIFAGVMTVASLLGGDMLASFWSNFERMDGLLTLYHLVILYLVLSGTLRERLHWERLLQMSIFVAIITGFVGLSQFLGVNLLLSSSGGDRISSTLGNASYLASYSLINLFFALYFVLKQRENTDVNWWAYGFAVLDLILVFFHLHYGVQAGRGGIITQIFSNLFLWLPLVVLHVIAFAYFFLKKNTLYQQYAAPVLYGIAAILFLIMTVTTQTRGALVGLVMGVVVAVVLLFFRTRERAALKVGAVALLLVLAAGAWFTFANKTSDFVRHNEVLNRIASISLTDATTQSRLATWNTGLQGFYEKPIFGWGMENFHKVFNKYFPPSIYTDEGTPLWFDRPHNLIIQYVAEGGLLGVGAYLFIIAALIIFAVRKLKSRYIGILWAAFVVAYVGQNLFVFDSINSYVPFYLAMGFMVYLIFGRDGADQGPVLRPMPQGIGAAASTVAVILVVAAIWSINVRPLQANQAFVASYRRLLSNKEQTIPKDVTDTILQIIDEGPYLGRAELMGVYSEYLVGQLQARSVPDYDLDTLVAKATTEFEKVIAAQPNDARYNLFLMNIYLNAQRLNKDYLEKLLTLADKTIPLSPTRPQIYYLKGRAHMARREYDEGLADFQKGASLAPNVFDAHWNLFAAYVTVSDRPHWEEEYAKIKTLKDFDVGQYQRVAAVFASGATKKYPEAVAALQEGIAKFPDNAALWASLADLYRQSGDIQKAKEAVAAALKLDPSMQAQADAFLQELAYPKK